MAGKGQTALVTGASMGIGVDLAECFAKDGYDLVLTARSEAALKEVADRLAKTYGVKTATVALDLGVPGNGAVLASAIAAQGFTVDVLVNNAGYGVAGAFDGSDRGSQLGMIDLNDRRAVELTHIYWHDMLRNKRGGVLNVASTASFPTGTAHGDLLRVEGVRALVQRGVVEGSRRHGCACELPLSRPDGEQISASARVPARRA
jgi:short-subunit dehydrogenase